MIFFRSAEAYQAWLAETTPVRRGLTGASLESAVAQLAASNPDLVTLVP